MKESQKERARKAMTLAWKIARQGAEKFGGSKRLYFRISLKMAWANVLAKKAQATFVYRVGLGSRYILPGLAMPKSAPLRGQELLPGIMLK